MVSVSFGKVLVCASCMMSLVMLFGVNNKANGSGVSNDKCFPVSHVSIIPQPQSVVYGKENVPIMAVSRHKDASLAEEAYKLDISNQGIHISYATDKGFKWAQRTLEQILLQQTEVDGVKTIPSLSISDAPHYAWRSFHLDVSRHMYHIDYLKKLIDCLAFYKINHLHLHLTDDQGWRIEIKKYPKLTQAGAWRAFDEYDYRCLRRAEKDKSFEIDPQFVRYGCLYGGYYTQRQMKQLVKYAAEKGINIIPEIDMPGHLSAAIRCYPDLQCHKTTGWGKEFSFPICVGREENYKMMKHILDEIMQIFPGPYIHIGADEVNKEPWEHCEKCQAMMRAHQLKDEEALCNYFVGQLADYVKSKGRTVVAWDDAYYAPDPHDFIYAYWRDWLPKSAATITGDGKKMVFTEWGHFYFSGRQSDRQLKTLYNYEPDEKFPGIVSDNMLGYQACVWTETIPNEIVLGHHVFPSLQAFAELAWSKQRDWDSFINRLPWHIRWIEKKGMSVRETQYR